MQEYSPVLIEPGRYVMQLDNLVGVNGIDRLYITPSESVEEVKLLISGCPITVTKPRISTTERLDGKVTFWNDWYLSKTNSRDVQIKIIMNDLDTVPTVQYRAKANGCKKRWTKNVVIPGQNWTPHPLVGASYNNILVYNDGMMTLMYAR